MVLEHLQIALRQAMAQVTDVPRRPSSSLKAFNSVSRGASLDTTAAGSEQSSASIASSCAGIASPILDTSSTLVFVDWDDTLFPSTELFDRWGLRQRSPDCEQQALLHRWREALQRFLKTIIEFSGHCVIVTNAQTFWVEQCLQRFAPELLHLLHGGGLTIAYAKEALQSLRQRKRVWQHDETTIPARYVDVYFDDEDMQQSKHVAMTAAKYHAMRKEFKRFFGGREARRNIINFGDMEYEHSAVQELGIRACGLHEPQVKSLLLPEVRASDFVFRPKF